MRDLNYHVTSDNISFLGYFSHSSSFWRHVEKSGHIVVA